jgi:hypothetical protein
MIISVISSGTLLFSPVSTIKNVAAARLIGPNTGNENNKDPVMPSFQKNLSKDYQNLSDLSVKVGPPTKGFI